MIKHTTDTTLQEIHSAVFIIGCDDGVQWAVIVPSLLLLRRRLSDHLLGDLPVCHVLLFFSGNDEAPDRRISASHERQEPIGQYFCTVRGFGEAGHHRVLLISHPRVLCQGLHLRWKGGFEFQPGVSNASNVRYERDTALNCQLCTPGQFSRVSPGSTRLQRAPLVVKKHPVLVELGQATSTALMRTLVGRSVSDAFRSTARFLSRQ